MVNSHAVPDPGSAHGAGSDWGLLWDAQGWTQPKESARKRMEEDWLR